MNDQMNIYSSNIPYIDTENIISYRNRIAMENDTIPKYIIINDNFDILNLSKGFGKSEQELREIYLKFTSNDMITLREEKLLQEISKITRDEDLFSLAKTGVLKYKDSPYEQKLEAFKNNKDIQYKYYKNIFINEEYTKINGLEYVKPYINEKIGHKFSTKKYTTLIDIFNNITTTSDIPYASLKDTSKIHDKLNINIENWFEYNEFITIKILQKDKINYSNVFINHEKNKIVIEFDIRNNELDLNETIKKIKKCIKSDKEYEHKESSITCVVKFPNQHINKYIFSYLVLNDIYINNFLSIDEHEKAIKRKAGLYMYFNHLKTGRIASILTTQYSSNSDETKIYGKSYLRLRLSKVSNIDDVNKIIEIFSKILERYNNVKKDVINIYDKYVKIDDKIKNVKVIKEITDLIDKKRCQSKRQPDVYNLDGYNKTDLELEIKENISLISPKGNKVYTCKNNNGGYPYIRIQQEKGTYCCYKKQKEKSTSILSKVNFITNKNRILIDQQTGDLPNNIKTLFYTIYGPGYDYYRLSTNSNSNDSLLNALNNVFPDKNITRDTLSKMNTALCRQELYDMTSEEIKNYIKSENNYLDPTLVLRLVEKAFQCNIVLFSYDNDGEMILPRHIGDYITDDKSYDKTVYIYIVHAGSKKHCELIISNKVKSYKYFHMNKNTKYMVEIYNSLFSNIKQPNISFLKDIQSQYIDSRGKTRILFIKYQNKLIPIETPPLKPLDVKEIYNTNNTSYSMKHITTYIKTLNTSLILDNKINKHKFTIDNIDYYIRNNKEPSILHIFNENRRKAKYLSQYILWLFSTYMKDKEYKYEYIDTFTKELIKISKDVEYVFHKQFSYGPIYVQNKEVKERLKYSIQMNYKNNLTTLKNYYKKIYINYDIELLSTDKTHIVTGGDKILQHWKVDSTNLLNIYDDFQVDIYHPYLINISNKLYIAQTSTNIKKAVNVSHKWNKFNINPGIHVEETFEKEYLDNINIKQFRYNNIIYYVSLLNI